MTRIGWTVEKKTHDPYLVKEKYPDPSVCETCNVVFGKGIYKWEKEIPENAHKIICPACRKIKDNNEGGYLVLEGNFLVEHKEEITNLIKNTEKLETEKRPLERIMEFNDLGNKIEIRTTYEHLPRIIGSAIHHAYKGDLHFSYPEGDKFIRAHWKREN